MAKNKLTKKEIDFTVNLDNMIPIQFDVNDEEKRFAEKYCENFEIKIVDINDVEVPYILLDPNTLLNWIVSIVRNYNRFTEDKN